MSAPRSRGDSLLGEDIQDMLATATPVRDRWADDDDATVEGPAQKPTRGRFLAPASPAAPALTPSERDEGTGAGAAGVTGQAGGRPAVGEGTAAEPSPSDGGLRAGGHAPQPPSAAAPAPVSAPAPAPTPPPGPTPPSGGWTPPATVTAGQAANTPEVTRNLSTRVALDVYEMTEDAHFHLRATVGMSKREFVENALRHYVEHVIIPEHFGGGPIPPRPAGYRAPPGRRPGR